MTAAVRAPRTSWTDILGQRKSPSLLGIVAQPTEDNRRWAHRRRSQTSATLNSPDIGDPLPCVVLDTSSTGARIKPHFARGARCQTLKDLPEKFTLLYTLDRMAIECQIAWRRDGEVGLRFISPARSIPKPPSRPMMAPKGKK